MSSLFSDGDLSVRRVTGADLPVLLAWLSDPAVLEWWEGRDQVFDADRVRDEFLHPDEGLTPCIAEIDGTPVGYIQYAELNHDEKAAMRLPVDELIYGIDQFLEPDSRDRGIGTALVRAMCDYLCRTFHPDRIVLDPKADNARAIHVYERCGFRAAHVLEKAERHEGVDRDCLLMELSCSPQV